MKIGIIGAMDCEVDGLKAKIENMQTETISNNTFCYGKILGKDVVVAKCGEGKVNSSVTTQTMILKYNPDIIINTGVAGGLHPDLGIMDIALAQKVCHHDSDTTPIGMPKGYVFGLDTVYIDTDAEITNKIEESAKRVSKSKILKGIIASGDQFIATNEQRERIIKDFNAIATEMEGACIGQVCAMNKKKFAVLRSISDGANSDSTMDFPTFAKKAADVTIEILLDFIDNL